MCHDYHVHFPKYVTRNGLKSRIVTQRSEKVKRLDNNATLYAFVELRCNVTDVHLFQLEPITLSYYVSQRVLKITSILVKHTCLEEKFGSTSKPTKDLYIILIPGRNEVISGNILNVRPKRPQKRALPNILKIASNYLHSSKD